MNNIWIFGDSYAEYYHGGNYWPTQLEDMCKDSFNLTSYAVSGSSLGYSLDRFQNVVKKKLIQDDDIVIFCLTGDERLYTKNMPHPRLGMLGPLEENALSNSEWYSWFKKNKEGLAWAVFNVFDPDINYELIKTASVLKVWADAHPKITVILFNNFLSKHVDLLKILPTTTNFYNLSQVHLQYITHMECGYDEISGPFEDRKFTLTYDNRSNHMTYANCNIMASMLNEVIRSKNPTLWDWNRFNKHILRYFEPKKK